MHRQYLEYVFVNINNYNFVTWDKYFPDGKVKLRKLCINPAWDKFFDQNEETIADLEKALTQKLKENKNIVPYPELIFNSLNILSPKSIKVVFLGQDPYIGKQQAMGLSFSVPNGFAPLPPSLKNIYANMKNFGHIREIPDTGLLSGWAVQGCFMINTSLTTVLGTSNAHSDAYGAYSDAHIEYINNNCDNIVFLAWGKYAHSVCTVVDHKKHKVIYSSHPSPYSAASKVNGFLDGKKIIHPSFEENDHFGLVNKHLKSVGKDPILWDIFDI